VSIIRASGAPLDHININALWVARPQPPGAAESITTRQSTAKYVVFCKIATATNNKILSVQFLCPVFKCADFFKRSFLVQAIRDRNKF